MRPSFRSWSRGILERPCRRCFEVNALNDSFFPIADMYLPLEHGSPKRARASIPQGIWAAATLKRSLLSG